MTPTEPALTPKDPNAWLAELKAGDKVIIDGTIRTVAAITNTQIVFDYGLSAKQRFKKDTGREMGGSQWSRLQLEQATPEAVARIVLKNKRQHLIDFRRWGALPADVIEQVHALVTAAKKTQEAAQ